MHEGEARVVSSILMRTWGKYLSISTPGVPDTLTDAWISVLTWWQCFHTQVFHPTNKQALCGTCRCPRCWRCTKLNSLFVVDRWRKAGALVPTCKCGVAVLGGWVSGDMGSMLPGQCSRGWPPMRQTGAAVPGLFWNLLMKNKLIRRLRASKVKLKWLPFYCWVFSVLNILFFIIQGFESDYFKFKSKTLDFDRRLGMLLCEGLCNCSGLESAFKVSSEEASKKVNYLNC